MTAIMEEVPTVPTLEQFAQVIVSVALDHAFQIH